MVINCIIFHLAFVIALTSSVFSLKYLPPSLPQSLQTLDIISEISADPAATSAVSTDYGYVSKVVPGAVIFPSSPNDISTLIRFSYSSPKPFTISPRGEGHSLHGQAFAPFDGIVVSMESLGRGHGGERINVTNGPNPYVDAGGEQLWIDVLTTTVTCGLSPRVFTDYLYITVGGTLSNAGIGGQVFRHGPQISNVYELDVITGKGEMVTCSKNKRPELFYGVLGGLGQFGVITRARIALQPAPEMVRLVRLMYTDVATFTKDQEWLISMENKGENKLFGFDYVEGRVILSQAQVAGLESSFFSDNDKERISELLENNHGPAYLLEGAAYYNNSTAALMDKKVKLLLRDLHYTPGFGFEQDVSYIGFLNRVHVQELQLQSLGLWEVPHPWLNLFVPKSRIFYFDSGVFKGIFKNSSANGLALLYPMNKNKWDERMSAVFPNEEIFYTVGLLWSAGANDLSSLQKQNNQVLQFCDWAGIKCKEYLPYYTNKSDWMKHFGRKWNKFTQRKNKFDPKKILSPGQQIFTSLMAD